MQAPAPDRHETPPFTTPNASMDERSVPEPAASDPADSTGSGTVDPLAAVTAKRIADAINDFKRELDQRDGTWAHVYGSLHLALKTGDAPKTFKLTVTPDEDGDEYPVIVHVALKSPVIISLDDDDPTTQPTPKPMRHASNAEHELERDTASRKKRKPEDGDNDEVSKRRRTSEEDEVKEIMPLTIKEHLDHMLIKFRSDMQDATENICHVERLLRRFGVESHEQATRDSDQSHTQQPGLPFRNSITPPGGGTGGSFPSSDLSYGDPNASIPEIIRRETALISRQIKWIEDCRRVANDVHVKREDTWRTSSASFHDQQRQDCENFQNRMIHESVMHSQTLNQILNEVKAIGLYAQNMKWETPSYLSQAPHTMQQIPTPPAFPTQQASPAFPVQPTRTPSSSSRPSDQQKHFNWKTGRGPGTQNG